MNARRKMTAAVAIMATAATAVLGGVFGGGDDGAVPKAQAAGDSQALLDSLLSELASTDTGAYVARLERRLEEQPGDANTLLLLGLAYQQRARETGNPGFYSRAERALRPAQRARATAVLANTGLASLAVSRHRFRAAIPLARAALRAEPDNGSAYGALGDALFNIGRYRAAFAAYDRMAEISPSVGSYGRIAAARELLARPQAAARVLGLALTLDGVLPEHRAAAHVQIGNINLDVGRVERGRRAYAAALAARPSHLPARAGLARVAAARGDYGRAVRLLRGVAARLDLPEYAIWYGDVLTAAGRKAEARRAYASVDARERRLEANGVRTELQTALFDADHGRRLADALARAREAYARAPSLDAADVLAWVLERNGRCNEALQYSRRSLRLDKLHAPKLFHRGMIERCLGDDGEARRWFRRALGSDPNFSVRWAPLARRLAGR